MALTSTHSRTNRLRRLVGFQPQFGRASGAEMDMRRKEQIAYEYLCHLEEAKL